MFDQTVISEHIEFAGAVNDLETLEALHSYWIYATQAIRPLIRPLTTTNRPTDNNGLSAPPATFYGWVTPTDVFMPHVDDAVTAAIGGVVCGTSRVTTVSNTLAYVIQVMADDGNDCGADGRSVHFQVGHWDMHHDHIWDNHMALFHSLETTITPIFGLTASNDSVTELGNATTFTATITVGDFVSYTWNFGDGNIGTGEVVTHTYLAAGVYTAVVTASNQLGSLTTETIVVVVDSSGYHLFLPL